MPKVEIDARSGFCHGVVSAIAKAEAQLADDAAPLYCLGDIVHNSDEVARLEAKGLRTITHSGMAALRGVKVLLRAHGEPPSTYALARDNGIEIIDATCPVVLRLQQRIKATYTGAPPEAGVQIVIYGKPGHAEVNGLVGQTDGTAIVVQQPADLEGRVDFSRPVELYSQTTKPLEGFRAVIAEIERRMAPGVPFHWYDTICRQVQGRVDHLRRFAADHDVVLFVSGAKSSNGKVLHAQCAQVNPATYLISGPDEVEADWLRGKSSIGVCGATSTPRWLMERVKERAEQLISTMS